jgi:hypothetical protein
MTRTGLTVAVLLASVMAAQARDPQFPAKGTPYPEAKDLLLKQGLFIGPEEVRHPNARFREIDCWDEGRQRTCRAAYVQKQPDGAGWYVVVYVDPVSLRVEDARFADVSELLAIPPPPAPDIPRLKGEYRAARDRLRALGFMPIPTAGKPGEVCKDRNCRQYVTFPETACSGTGINFCVGFWLAPDKRVLKVTTAGELPFVYHPEWSSRKEQRRDTRF